jgi:hypothetical protein
LRRFRRRGEGSVPLTARDYVAAYAAVVATAAFGWQVWSSYRARRPQVTLWLEAWRTKRSGGKITVDDAEVRIRNRGDNAVRVDRLYFRHSFPFSIFKHAVTAEIEAGDAIALPLEVPARDALSLTLRPSQTYTPLGSLFGVPDRIPKLAMELRTGERYVSHEARQRRPKG